MNYIMILFWFLNK